MQDCNRAAAAVADFKHKLDREPSLADVFRKAISADGSVFVDFRVSDDEFEMTRRRYRREVVGRIDGHAAGTTKSPKPLIQGSVLPLVHSLTEEMMSGADQQEPGGKVEGCKRSNRHPYRRGRIRGLVEAVHSAQELAGLRFSIRP